MHERPFYHSRAVMLSRMKELFEIRFSAERTLSEAESAELQLLEHNYFPEVGGVQIEVERVCLSVHPDPQAYFDLLATEWIGLLTEKELLQVQLEFGLDDPLKLMRQSKQVKKETTRRPLFRQILQTFLQLISKK